MNRDVMAVCLAIVMVTAAFTVVASTNIEAATDYSDNGLNVSNISNLSSYHYAGETYQVIRSANENQYHNYKQDGFTYKSVIIDAKYVKADAFEGITINEVLLTENVERIETDAFRGHTSLQSVFKLGDSPWEIEEGAFSGCTNIAMLDVRYATVAEGATDDDCDALVITNGQTLTDFAHGNILEIDDDIQDLVYLMRTRTNSQIQLVFHGEGVLDGVTSSGSVSTRTYTTQSYGLHYRFNMPFDQDSTVDYARALVDYGGYGSRTIEIRNTENALLTPDLAPGAVFPGWEDAGSGTEYGDTLSVKEFEKAGVRQYEMVPIGDAFPIAYDMGDIPSTENVAPIAATTSADIEVYPMVADTEHYSFEGWTIDGIQRTIPGGSPVNVYGSQTLVAQWEISPDSLWDVTLLDFAGEPIGSPTEVTYRGMYTIPAIVPNDVPLGKGFIGWELGGTTYFVGDRVQVLSDTDLTPLAGDIITVPVNTGQGSNGLQLVEGSKHTLDLESPENDDERIFIGWLVTGTSGLLQNGDDFIVSSVSSITAAWRDRETYDITFENGGQPVCTLYAREGIAMTITVDDPYSTEDVFIGWSSDGYQGPYFKGDSVTFTGATTMDAQWRARATYDVTFVDGEDEYGPFVAREGIEFAIPLDREDGPSKTFVGWVRDSDPQNYDIGDRLTLTGNTEFTAVWDAIMHSVTYVSEGSTLGSVDVAHGEDIEVGTEVSRDWYTLVSWNDGTTDHQIGSSYTVEDDVTFTAVWEIVEHTVTYVSEGSTVETEHVPHGDQIVVGADVSRDGYALVSWNDGTADQQIGSSYTVEDDVVFTAVWEIVEYTVTYVSEGSTLRSMDVPHGDQIVVGTDVSRDGYVLKSWNDGTADQQIGSSYTVEDDVTFTAVWQVVEHTVTYVSEGSTLRSVDVPHGDQIVVGTEVSRDGYVLDSWNDGTDDVQPGSSYTIRDDVTFTAVWEMADDTRTVTFVSEGTTVASRDVSYGDQIVVDTEVSRDGYILKSWNDGTDDLLPGSSYTVEDDVTFTAVWEAVVNTYTVTLHLGGGSVESFDVDEDTFVIDVEPPIRDGYTFVGWSTEEGGSKEYEQGDTIALTSDIDLYPVWTGLPSVGPGPVTPEVDPDAPGDVPEDSEADDDVLTDDSIIEPSKPNQGKDEGNDGVDTPVQPETPIGPGHDGGTSGDQGSDGDGWADPMVITSVVAGTVAALTGMMVGMYRRS